MSKLDSREEAQGHVPGGGLAGHSIGDIYPLVLEAVQGPSRLLWNVVHAGTGRGLRGFFCAGAAYAAAVDWKRSLDRQRAALRIAQRLADEDRARRSEQSAMLAKQSDVTADVVAKVQAAPSPLWKRAEILSQEHGWVVFDPLTGNRSVGFPTKRDAEIQLASLSLRNMMHS